MARLKLLLPLLLIPLAALWAAYFKKHDRERCFELLRFASKPDDIILVAASQSRGAPWSKLKAKKILFADDFRADFFNQDLNIALEEGTRKRRLSFSGHRGRMLILFRVRDPFRVAGSVSRVRVGSLEIAILNSAEIMKGRWNLMQVFHGASVARRHGGMEKVCPLAGEIFRCGSEEWMDVRAMQLPFGGVIQYCIFAHPADGGVLSLDLAVPSSTGSLLISGGIDDFGIGYAAGASVVVRAGSGGRWARDIVFENMPGFFSRKVNLPGRIEKGGTLSLEVTSTDQDARHFCFSGFGQE